MAVTPEEVKGIYLEVSNLTDAQIQPFIDVTDAVSAKFLVSSTYSPDLIKSIELYLTAHYLSVSMEKGGLERKKTGDSEERYRSLSTEQSGIALSVYGQQALALDYDGELASLASSELSAQFRVV